MSARRLPFRVIEGGGQPQPRRENFDPAHGMAIAFVGAAIFWIGVGAAVLAWWERP